MKLYYITRVNIPSTAAQSVQISSMCEAFSNKKIEFKFEEFVENNKKKYPELSTIFVSAEEIILKISIDKIDTDWNGNIDFVANKGYRRKILK